LVSIDCIIAVYMSAIILGSFKEGFKVCLVLCQYTVKKSSPFTAFHRIFPNSGREKTPAGTRPFFPASTAVFSAVETGKKLSGAYRGFFWHMRMDHFFWRSQWFFPQWTPELNSLPPRVYIREKSRVCLSRDCEAHR